MDLESYLLKDREVPFEDVASFSVALRGLNRRELNPEFTKEAKLGTLKLLLAKHAQGEEAQALQNQVMLDPQVQQALDFQAAQAQAQHSTQQLIQAQQQMEAMQQGMQQLQQQAEQTGQQLQMTQQENSQLQEQLQGEMQMRQQSNMQAMQAQDQAINTKAMAQKQRHELSQMADQMSLQLKQVAAQDPEQAQMQQQQAAMQQQEAEQQAALAAMPAKQRKEIEEAQKAQQNAEVQGQQAEQAQVQGEVQGPMAAAMQQQAAAQQQQQMQAAQQPQPQQAAPQEGGMVAQSSAGMSKVDILRYRMRKAAGVRDAYSAGRVIAGADDIARAFGKKIPSAKGAKNLPVSERAALHLGRHRDKYVVGGTAAGASSLGFLAGRKSKEKKSSIPNYRAAYASPEALAVKKRLLKSNPNMDEWDLNTHPDMDRAVSSYMSKEKNSEIEKRTCGANKLAQKVTPEEYTKLISEIEEYEKKHPLLNKYTPVGRYNKAYRLHYGQMSGKKLSPQESEYLEMYNPSGSVGRDAQARLQALRKEGMVPPPNSVLKARLIEAGVGAGLGAITGAAYEAGRQRFSHTPPTSPSPAEIDLDKRNRAAQIKAKESPTLINRIAATKTLAELDAERDMRANPNKAILRRALQGAIVGGSAAPLVVAAKQNLSPRIMGR